MKNILFLILTIGGFLTSCSKMADVVKPYLKDGDLVYVGAPYNVVVTSGVKSVNVQFNKTADPAVEKYIIYWNNRAKNQEIIPTESVMENAIIKDLSKGNYNFELMALDNSGHKSKVVYATGIVE